MTEQDVNNLLDSLEQRVSSLEEKLIGSDREALKSSRIKNGLINELEQIDGHITRAVANRETITKLFSQVDELISLLDLEKSSSLLGGEEKANAILAAEPIIRQIHGITKQIDLKDVNNALNSEAIRNLESLSGQLAEVKLTQMKQDVTHDDMCDRISRINEVISILLSSNLT